ncbi:TPA: autotransporter outer membrane beta-barrel domain-containing protein [Mannheimia haemolytica]|nr:autotransporter outer membrane beta-barrel domain-containing protein [Mannheimia haemolytica]
MLKKANSTKVQVNQYQFGVAENKGRVQGSLGLSAGNGNHRLGLEASVASGKKLKQPFNVLVNYRYQ